MTERLKSLFSFFLRFGISGISLAWLFKTIHFQDMWLTIKGADANYISLAFLIYVGINFIILWRWMILMHALGLKFHWFSATRWFFFGLFWNLCLPTSVGGDVVKGVGLAKETKNKPKVFASIVLDRLAGFSGIIITSCLAFWGGRKIVQNPLIVFSIISMTVVSLVLIIVLFNHRIFSWATRFFGRWPRIKEGLMNLHYDLVLMKGKQKEIVFTISLSIVAQLILAFDFYLTAKALHQNIPLIYFAIFSPLVCVATSLPSIGGLGVRECSWAGLLTTVGVVKEVGSGLGVINSLFMYTVGIAMGGLLYVITLSSRRVQHHTPGAPLG